MKKIVVIGGGTGNFTVLSGLKNYDVDLSAIVSMADDGGSTGILRDELGVLPPGDVRQCLVALSNSSLLMRSMMNYRFENGGLGGHSFGNLFLSVLEKVTGSFEKAVEEMGRILFIQGKVIPVTTHQVRLKMILNDRRILEGEKEVYLSEEIDRGYKLGYHKAAKIAEIGMWAELWAVTDLSAETVSNVRLRPFNAIQEAVDFIRAQITKYTQDEIDCKKYLITEDSLFEECPDDFDCDGVPNAFDACPTDPYCQ